MSCSFCTAIVGSFAEVPFAGREMLYDTGHEDVFIDRCETCGAPYLGLGLDIYDEYCVWWARISEEEVNDLKNIDINPWSIEFLIIKRIRRNPVHIRWVGTRGIEIVQGHADIVYGLPHW